MKKLILGLGAVAVGLVVLSLLSSLTGRALEGLWLHQAGYAVVFWRVLGAQALLFAAGFTAAFLYAWAQFRAAVRWAVSAGSGAEGAPLRLPGGRSLEVDRRALKGAALASALVAALVVGVTLAMYWPEYLLFRQGENFGIAEPIFGKDVGFYAFRLDFYEIVQGALTFLAWWVLAVLAFFYGVSGALPRPGRKGLIVRSRPFRHLSLSFAVFALGWGGGYFLDRYGLLFSASGAVYGAGYTDVHVLKHALWVMVAASVLVGAAAVAGSLRRSLRTTLAAFAGYGALLVLLLWAWPAAVQTFRVRPNELELETPYLENGIRFTRSAYGLDAFRERDYPALDDLAYQTVLDNEPTLDNIRLWDWRPLTRTYRQMQEIRLYYKFYEVDVDRYRLEDGYRQVMLSARELEEELPEGADTWVNRVLQFTHGYGLAMSLATQASGDGLPRYVIRDLPPVADPGLRVDRPAIYYGEQTPGYRIVNTEVSELDYPRGDENIYTHYAGSGGILLDAWWKRLLLAWELKDVNILLSSYIRPESRLQLWRQTRERVAKVAPFLELDPDPYLVLSEGRLYWILDAYTVSRRYPYSEPHFGRFNYIRNSVKAVVDAYEGSVELYAVEPDEPILAAWGRIFPGILRPLDSLPEDLRRHLRYPVELFRVQVEKLNAYHMTVPQVYYNREDLWTIPREKYAGNEIDMEPYYVMMRLPGRDALEFLLMTPLTPRGKDNMIAWVAAHCDMPRYGEVVVYKLPKERLIYGPLQIEAVIDQNTEISQQLSLWDQRGSQVIRGNLLVIPIGESFLYVEPVYLLAEGTDIPQLRRVIAALRDRVAMEPTLGEAVRAVFGVAQRPATGREAAPAAREAAPRELREVFREARRALREGRWSDFGDAMETLERDLAVPVAPGAKP